MGENDTQGMTFWDHLDEFRKIFFRMSIVMTLLAIIVFINKDFVFDIIFAPQSSDFILYESLNRLGEWLSMPSIHVDNFRVELINIELTSQFFVHMSTSFYVGFLLASPYFIYQIFSFIRPALYEKERQASTRIIVSAYLLFMTGILLNYFLIFPLSFRFLATYQVSDIVANKISLSSYIDTFITLSLMLGATFEIPVVAYFFAKFGFITSGLLRRYRKHALIVILILAAIITPTTDIFTLLLVSVPMYALYELSIGIVSRTTKRVKD